MKKIIIFVSLMLLLFTVAIVYSQEPPPTPTILSQPQQNKTKPKQTESNYKERGSDELPLIVKIIDTNEPKSKEGNQTKTANENTTVNWLLVFFNGLLAIFTFGLYVSTYKLWKTTNRVANATKDAADAAKKSAESLPLIENAYIFVEVEEDIDKKAAKIPFNELKIVVITVRNYGRTPAIIKEACLWMDTDVAEIPEENRVHVPGGEEIKIIPGVVLSNGKSISQNAQVVVATTTEWDKIKNGQTGWHCWGSIKYENIFEGICEVGFDWKWHPLLGRFICSNNEELNYHKQHT